MSGVDVSKAVTVAIPTYNGERYVAQAVESALATGSPVIVSDDGSTDRTRAILQRYASAVTIHTEPKNRGIAANYQRLLEECRTPLALFLNQDDVLIPHRIRRLPVRLDEMTIFNGWLIDEEGSRDRLIYRRPPFHASMHGVYQALVHESFLKSPSQAIFPVKSALAAGGFIIEGSDGQGAEDWLCWLRLASTGTRFRLRMRPTMGYRVHSRSYSNQASSHLRSKHAVRATLPPAPARDRRLRVRW